MEGESYILHMDVHIIYNKNIKYHLYNIYMFILPTTSPFYAPLYASETILYYLEAVRSSKVQKKKNRVRESVRFILDPLHYGAA
jgi:hypothetical protein